MISDQKKEVLALFAEGLKHYKLMEFREAKNYFIKAAEVDPNDGPSKKYIERCNNYIENPPPPDWDGVYTMTKK
ncbi:MAG: hypothetical protein JW881_15515 [Spirochaetales bacterium]|nr:hypothetical protein [Spirochaetales bacterium]